MKKSNKFLYKICLGLILAVSTLSTKAQEIPPIPANVVSSNYYTANYAGSPIFISNSAPDAVVSFQITNATGKIWDVNLQTTITHTFNGDLNIFLTSPQGTQAILTTQNGNGFDDGFNGTWWDDQASTNVSDATYVDLVAQPTLQPEGSMSVFDGENPNGTWTLTIIDIAGGDEGFLNSAKLDITTYIGTQTFANKNYTNSTSTPLPDFSTNNSTINVSGQSYRISQVRVFTKIFHTSPNNLGITLTSPNGTLIALSTGNGGSSENAFNGTLWDDNTSEIVTDTAYPFILSPKLTLNPEGTLGAFKGENPNGIWTLTIADTVMNNTGTLENWYLEITTSSAGINDMDGDGYTDIVGLNRKEVRVLSQVAGVTSSNAVSFGDLPKGYKAVGGFDANTDGISDLIVQRKDQVSYLLTINKAISSLPTPLGTTPKRHKAVASGDINSDDSTDIIVTRGKTIGALMGPSYTFQEITDENKNGKVVGVVQTNIITQKGKKVFRIPITASLTAGDAVSLTEDADSKIVGVSVIDSNEGLEIIAQKKKDVTYGPWETGDGNLDLWTDKGVDKDGQLGKVIAPK